MQENVKQTLTADKVDFSGRVEVVHLGVDGTDADSQGAEDSRQEAHWDGEQQQTYDATLPSCASHIFVRLVLQCAATMKISPWSMTNLM